ncbi:hypothetical protein DFH09DRAFT_1122796 [Mycena vulgaris]|nr:hypothetical protein DFH09DRAFT_1122796 [Mycena vulgaris]
MPLVLHPSSCCDVCLDSYSWETQEDSPHAIPCGHIFCRTCLVTVEPTNCPLCRKAFNRERIKKLHVDRPETDTEADLLQRVALAFDADPDAQTHISTEIEAWLTGRSDDDHVALRKAWAAFKIYNALAERKLRDKKIIKQFERRLRDSTEESEFDRDTFKAVESSLLAQVQQLTAQVADLAAQVNPLRLELSKYQHTSNPLPPPPEPVPLDRFPAFARATAESAEGYAAYFTPDATSGLFSNLPHDAPEPRVDKGKKGKGKQPQQPTYGFYDPVPNATGNVIIPGATPSQRVIPTDDRTYHTHAPASAYVDGYATGFGLGYDAANAGVGPDANHASTSAYQLPPQPREPEESLEDAIGGLRLWGVPAASAAIAPVAARPPDSAPATMPLRRRRAYIAPSHDDTEDDVSVSSQPYPRPMAFRRSTVQIDGQLQPPSTRQPPPIYAAPAPPVQSEVRFNMQVQDDAPPVANDAIARRAAHERNRANRQSYSSWGTVHTNGTENSPAGTRGSMSEFGDIANFPMFPQGEGRRNSTLSDEILDRGMVATPRPEAPPLGFLQAAPVRPGHAHSYSLSSLEAPHLNEANSLPPANHVNNRQRTVPRRFSQLPVGASEFGVVPAAPPFTMATEPPPIQNALGLDLGAEATEPHRITAPTPRVQTTHFMRSWELDSTVR